MKKVDFNFLIQLLGMIGIIGSLLFVGLEMRQSQRIALAGHQQDRMAVFVDITNTFTEAGINSILWNLKKNMHLETIFMPRSTSWKMT